MLKNSKNLTAYDYGGACSFYLGAIVVTLLCQATAGIASSALARSFPDIAKNGDFNTAFMIFVQCANIAFIYFYTKLRRSKFDFTFVRRDGDGKGVTPSVIIVPIIAACALMVAMYLPTLWYGYMTSAMGVPESAAELNLDTVSSIVMVVVASVFLAPMAEETIYRGVLLHGLKREKSAIKAVMLSAVAFMLMHMNVVQVVFQFALGVLSGFIAIKAKRLLPCILLHASANALALAMQLTPFAAVLAGCEAWLCDNIAAAVFITLGLLAAGGGVLFLLVGYGFEIKSALSRFAAKMRGGKTESAPHDVSDGAGAENAVPADGAEVCADGGSEDNAIAVASREVKKAAGRSDGTFKYFIGVGICAVMLIVNLITVILS